MSFDERKDCERTPGVGSKAQLSGKMRSHRKKFARDSFCRNRDAICRAGFVETANERGKERLSSKTGKTGKGTTEHKHSSGDCARNEIQEKGVKI